ncbi:PEGA domain-containing protein [Opitutus sp. ER46]|uniref:PEGA domain-containing protein n=1 Tax=Opitutus sp. ER46 TaxID=2161864 RepID=UPI000D31043E|nr:PEGA domain-containing protein [Opitutus sp. ER46]PTX98513.1 PEGA domain-containing protein [Opitutus sp. ER46]
MKKLFSLLATVALAATAFAAGKTAVQESVTALPTQVQERTYQVDGKTVTERITTSQVKETKVSTPIPQQFRAAIFIANRAGSQFDPQMEAFEDLVTARVTDLGFQVLSKGVIADSMRKFDPALASRARPADSLDTQLSERSSALRLAQGLGADYLLVASIVSVGTKERATNAYGLNAVYSDTTLRFSYKVIDGQTGATLTSDADKVTYSAKQTENSAEKSSDVTNELLDEAATKVAQSLGRKIAQDRIAAPSAPAAAAATLTINTEVADIVIPDVRIVNNTVTIGAGHFKVGALNAVVEIDGVAVGSAPGTLSVKPGFSKLRITREGFKPWERTINVFNGQTLNVALELTPEAYARFKDATAFLNALQNGAKLTDAQVKVLEGRAKMLSQSGYKVDTKDAPATNIFLH